IIGIGVHLITIPRLGRTAVAPPVMRDDSKTAVAEEKHLCVPVVGGEWPAMAENYWLPFAPILVIDLTSICCRNCWHDFSLLFKSGTSQPSCAQRSIATLTRQRIRQPSSKIHLLLPGALLIGRRPRRFS